MLLFISQVGNTDNFLEKKEVRRLALTIDQMKPGTELVMDVGELCRAAIKNNFGENLVTADYTLGILTVKTSDNKGNSFRFFSQLEIGDILFDSNKCLLTIKT